MNLPRQYKLVAMIAPNFQSAKATLMQPRDCDIAIVGGGLSGCLIALALARHRPELTVRLIEAGPELGGNHRWSWFASDLDGKGDALLSNVRKVEWEGGYDVCFPHHARHLRTPYRSISSADLAATLQRELPPEALLTRRECAKIDASGIALRDGTQITARAVIDARGFATSGDLTGGWQVFMGRHMRTEHPHGVARPVIMDAGVEQLGGYRFLYVLPLGSHDLFLEDTYYQDTPLLDRSALSARIDAYAREQGWHGEPVSFETGVLPVITGGDFAAWQRAKQVDGVAMAGARGGFVHPLTSYTLPFAVRTALEIARNADLPGDQLAALLQAKARAHWRRMGFYRKLGRMLFQGARPHQRYRIFERFYRLPEPLIERFYAGRSTLADKARILAGRPPIPILRGIGALMSSKARPLDPNRKDSK